MQFPRWRKRVRSAAIRESKNVINEQQELRKLTLVDPRELNLEHFLFPSSEFLAILQSQARYGCNFTSYTVTRLTQITLLNCRAKFLISTRAVLSRALSAKSRQL